MKVSVLAAVLVAAASSGAIAQEQVKITGWISPEPARESPPPAAPPIPWHALPIEPERAPAPPAPPAPTAPGKPKVWSRLAGEPVVAGGEVRPGQPLLTFPVEHLFTGRLAAEPDRFGGVFSGVRMIPAGSPVYALPLAGKVSWCAPRRIVSKDGSSRWDADCFIPHGLYPGLYSYATGLGNGLMVGQAQGHGGAVRTPQIREQPIDFGEHPILYVRFERWDKRMAVVQLDTGGVRYPRSLRYYSAPREADGSAIVKLLDGELRLVPSGDGLKSARIEVIRPPSGKAASPY